MPQVFQKILLKIATFKFSDLTFAQRGVAAREGDARAL
jgi:hypothetical protein